MSKFSVISNIRKNFISSFLKNGRRVDGREFGEYREIRAESGVVPNAEGSALVSIGETQVIAGIKLDILEPFPDEPNKGVLMSNAELLPLASKYFEPGPPDETSIEFARVVDRAIRHSEAIDYEALFVEEGKVIGIFLDLYVLDYAGNMFDAAALAASLALKTCRLPKIEDGRFIRTETAGKLPVDEKSLPTSTMIASIDGHHLVDPDSDEEMASDASIVIGVVGDEVCSIQKRGTGSFKKTEVLNMVDVAFEKHKELRKYLEG